MTEHSGRARARDLGIRIGRHETGESNAITDVQDVTVGHTSLIHGEGPLEVGKGPVRSGVTMVVPHGDGVAKDPVFAGYHQLNGNGEMTGVAWIEESGLLTSPIAITNTHRVGTVRDAIIAWEVQAGAMDVKDLLGHLYVLLPVLDGAKHYWVDESEIDKLLRAGDGWLGSHPERDVIIRRFMKGQRSLADQARDRLLAEDVGLVSNLVDDETACGDEQAPLNRLRIDAVVQQLKRTGAKRILDLGCGEGRLIEQLLQDPSVAQVAGMDVSVAALQRAGSGSTRCRTVNVHACRCFRAHLHTGIAV